MEKEEIIEKIKKAALFFRDESVPMGARVGVAGAIALLLTFPFWVNLGKHDPMKDTITSDSFPKGPSGLNDSSAKDDNAKAALIEYNKNKENPSKSQDSTKQEEKTESPKKEDLLESLPEENVDRGPFKILPVNLKVPRAIIQGNDKTVWLADKSGILSFKDGALSKAKLVMNSESYDAEFNADLPPISSIYAADDGSLWTGFSDGTLMRYARYEWKHIRGKNREAEDSITAFTQFGEKVFIGSKNLFHWDNKFGQILVDPEWKGKWITALATSSEKETYMASKENLYIYQDGWKPFWQGSKEDKSISNISFANDGSLLLGTSAGLVRISKKGVILERALIGEKIQNIISGPDNTLWVGSRGHGLRYFDGENWYGANSKHGLGDWSTELLIDSQNRLWVGVTGLGILIAKESKAAEWIKNYPDQDQSKEEPKFYKSACAAADELINKVSFSGQVASRVIDGTRYVFFNGHQVCPEGVGYYRNDNSVILLKDWNLITFHDDKREEFTLVKEYPADRINIIYYDSKNQIWAATPETGLSRLKEGKWEDLGILKNNPVSSLIEAADGTLWIGTTPPYDKEQNTYHEKNLHLYSENASLKSYDSRDGLKQNSTLALSQMPDGRTAIATRLGVSIITPDNQIANYGKEQGLNFEHSADVSFDSKGRIWIGHQYFGNGLTWIDKNNVYYLTKEQGLFTDKVSHIAIDRKGNIWILASNGDTGVYPRKSLEEKATKIEIPDKLLRKIPLGTRNLQ